MLHRLDEVDAVPLLVLQEPTIVQDISEVPVPSPVVRGSQPMDVELALDVPVLHWCDDYFNLAQLDQELPNHVIVEDIPEVHVHSPVAPHAREQALAQDFPEVPVQSLVDISLSPAGVFWALLRDRIQQRHMERTAPLDM